MITFQCQWLRSYNGYSIFHKRRCILCMTHVSAADIFSTRILTRNIATTVRPICGVQHRTQNRTVAIAAESLQSFQTSLSLTGVGYD